MPAPVFAFVAAFATAAVAAGTITSTVLAIAVVSAVLTQAASILYRQKQPVLNLPERKQVVRVPTPTRKILYGELEIGAAIVDLQVRDYKGPVQNFLTTTNLSHFPEVHILPYRPSDASTVSTGTGYYPIVRATSLPDRATLEAAGNLTEEWTIYYTDRTDNDHTGSGDRFDVRPYKTLDIIYALTDNRIRISDIHLGGTQVTGETGVDRNGDDTQYRGDLYIRPRDTDSTDTVLLSAQGAAHRLSLRNPGIAAAFLWDTSGEGTLLDILTPRGTAPDLGMTSDQFRPSVFVHHGYPYAGPYPPERERLDADVMGDGVALMAASYMGIENVPNVPHRPWPQIPQLTVTARGEVATDTWTEVERIVNDSATYAALAYNNSAVCLYDYIRKYTEYGTDILGIERIDEASVRQAIVDCHDLGLTANAYVDLDSRPDDVIAQFALAMRDGDAADIGGILHITVGKPVAATATITEDDILDDWSYVGGLPRDKRPDAINLEYPTTSGVGNDTIALSPTFIRGGGTGNTEDLTVAYAGSREQALDVGAVRLLKAQESRTLEVRLRVARARLLPHDTVMVDIPTLFGDGAGPQKYRVLSVKPQPDLSIAVVMREERDQIWGGYDFLNPSDVLLLESGDKVLLETGDNILIA